MGQRRFGRKATSIWIARRCAGLACERDEVQIRWVRTDREGVQIPRRSTARAHRCGAWVISGALVMATLQSASAWGGVAHATRSIDVKALAKIGGPLYPDGGPQPCHAAYANRGPAVWTAPQIAAAYGFDGLYRSHDRGAGVVVGVIAYGSVPTASIRAFDRCYGIVPRYRVVNVAGGVTGAVMGTPGSAVSGWGTQLEQVETAADVETISVLAPKATIVIYDDPSGTKPVDAIIAAIVADASANVISDSYLGCESPTAAATEIPIFEQAAAQGESVLAASGDSGAFSCATDSASPNVDDPASNPLVTAVGGTTLTASHPDAETAWTNSGGGISGQFSMPAFQIAAAGFLKVIGPQSSGTPCAAGAGSFCREVPDVSALAGASNGSGGLEELLPIPGGGQQWGPAGGTSVSAPIWSALVADLDSAPGCGSLGELNPKLYAAAGTTYRSDFHDIVAGTTRPGQRPSQLLAATETEPGTNSFGYSATVGYDLTTGLGTPRLFAPHGQGLAHALCPTSTFATSG